MIQKLYARWQKEVLEQAMKTRRIVLLSGARQCGKTTLAKQIVTGEVIYRTLDDLAIRRLAEQDPQGFVRERGQTLIIDEVERVPELFSAIKMVVDLDPRPGQFLLTGSANVQSLPSVRESLAGRVRKVQLRPLSEGEVLGVTPTFLARAFSESFSKQSTSLYDRKTVLDLAFRGGFPEAMSLAEKEREQWHRDYMAALLERDLRDLTHITRHRAMKDLLHTLAAWSGKLMDLSSLSAGLSIRRPTTESYINALEALYLTERIHPWTRTDYARIGKQTKFYMTDSGLMASTLRWRKAQVALDPDRSGKLIETFIFNELAAQIERAEGEYELFHYRDREQREIDFLIERDDHVLLGIEVKAGSSLSPSDFKHLKWFRDNIAKERPFIGILLYSGEAQGSMGEKLWAVPFGSLWE